MEFKKFLEMISEVDLSEAKKKKKTSTAERDDKAEKAGQKVTRDIEQNDKKKSLKDWFELIDKNMIAEAEQITLQPAKQSTQVIKQGNKTLGTVTNPALAANIKSAIGKGEMSLAGSHLKEEPVMEKAPPGMEDVVLSLKKKFPGEEGRAYAIAWSMYNKKHGKNESAEDNPESAMLEADVEESGLQAYLGRKKYGKKGMMALQQAGREGASKETMAKIRAKHDKLDEKWAGDAKVKPTGEYKDKTVAELRAMLAKLHKSGPHKKGSPEATKQSQINFALRAKGGWKKGEGAAMKEAEIPSSGQDYGAGLGAGRSDNVLETKQVNEAMNTLEAAYHEGKSHGLSKHGYACRYNEGSDEHRRYHEGYKEGLDECYGLMPNRGLIVSEKDSEHDIVDRMASYGAEDLVDETLDEMDKTEWMKHKARTTPGDTFKAFGQTMHDKDVLETDHFAFESLEKQLNALINEDSSEIENTSVNEGLSVSMSTGQEGAPDSVSVTGTDHEAAKLLAFIKQVGLGGMGADKELTSPSEPAVAVVSDYGAPKFSGHDDMVGLMKLASDDHEHDHGHPEACNECGMAMSEEGGCGCDKKMVDEVETNDQLEYEVAEGDGEGYTASQADAGKIDAALAMSGASKGGATNEDGAEAPGSDPVGQAEQEEAEEVNESSFFDLYKKLAMISEESTAEKDDRAKKAGEKVTKDIEDDEGHKGKDDERAEKAGREVAADIRYDDKKDKKLDEWANDAGKDGTQQSFERDIEFMTKVIAGGLNKPKATGQTTIPVIAGQNARIGDEDVTAWKKLAGIKK